MLVLILTAALATPSPPRRVPHVAAHATALRSDDLFSHRARRRFAAYLRMRLLEMREEGLERAAEAVEHSRPAAELLDAR